MAELAQVRNLLITWLLLTGGGIALAWAAWFWLPQVRRWLAPQPSRPAPWGSAEIYLLIVAYCFLPSLIYWGLSHTPLLGPDDAAMAHLPHAEQEKVRAMRAQPWVRLTFLPVFVIVLGLLTPHGSGTLAGQFGLRRPRLGANLGLGLLAALVLTPAVNAVYAAVTWALLLIAQVTPEEHLLTQLARQTLTPVEWTALVASAILAAPLLEEVFFRGVLQRWLAPWVWGGDVAIAAAFAFALLARREPLGEAWSLQTFSALALAAAPALFVIALAFPYLLVRCSAAGPSLPTLYGTAVLFAAVHATVWPTPIPLFVLGLGLGLLADRTQSLGAPITVHALFNAAACGILLYSGR